MAKVETKDVEDALGFSAPPHRLDYENQRTDYGIGAIGLHWVMLIMHLPAYRAARFNVAAAAEINEDRIRETQQKGFDVGPILDDWRELVRRDDVDVIDCTFGPKGDKELKRLQVVEAAAEAGKAVMIHKPVASTLSVAEQMAQVAQEAGIWLAVNQNCRYNPACYCVKQLLRPDRLGPAGLIEVRNYWRGDPKSKSDENGAWVGHTIHHADLIRWWVDSPCTSVFCEATMSSNVSIYEFQDGTVAYHMENHTGVEAHETYMRVQAEKGVIRARHNWNWHFAEPRDYEYVEVFPDTSEPGVRLPLPKHVYEPVWYGLNPWEPVTGPWYDLAGPVAGMMGTMGSLMRALQTNQPPDNHVEGAIESLRICLAAQISAKTGKPVDPREVPPETVVER